MNLKQGKFPFDSQKCPLEIGSFGYHAGDVQYEWAGQAIEFGKFEMAEMALKEFHHGVRKRDISVCVRVGLRYKMRAFMYFLLSVTVPSSSCQVQVGHGSDSKLYYWMIYLRLSRWPLVWPIGSWRAGSGTTLSPSSRWNYFSFFFSIFFKVGLWEGEWLLLAWHLLSPHACCRLLLGRSWNTEFTFLNFQDRLSVVLNWSEWAAHPLSI